MAQMLLLTFIGTQFTLCSSLCINSWVRNQTGNSNTAHYDAEKTQAHPNTLLGLIGSAKAALVLFHTI